MKTIMLQKRDTAILLALAQVVILDTLTIWQRWFPNDRTKEACWRRLRLLCAHDLIRQVSFPMVSTTGQPSKLVFYHLTRAGADLLGEITGFKALRVLRSSPRPQTLFHRRDLARVMLAVNDAATLAGLPDPQWILEQDQRPGMPRNASRTERHILYEDFPVETGEIVQLRPDASTWFRFPGNGGAWHDLLVWWEIDRSTETLAQVSPRVAAFNVLLCQHEPTDPSRRLYRRHWPQVREAMVRVFFVCPSLQRVATISSAISQIPGAEYVRLATLDSLTPDRFLADAIWHDVNGKQKAIFPRVLHSEKS